MLKFVRTMPKDIAAQMVERWLNQQFGNDEGICYYRHPAIVTSTEVIPDFILFTRTNQPLIIKIMDRDIQDIGFVEDEVWVVNGQSVDSPLLELEDLVLKMESKFLEQRKLRNRLNTQAILAFPFITQADFEENFGILRGNISPLWKGADTQALSHPLEEPLSDEEWTLTRSIIQGATHLHRPSNIPPPSILRALPQIN